MEVLNDLVGYNNLKIYQNTDWFSFSLDSVLLPNFVTLKKNITNIIDLGTGNAPMPLILSTKTNAKIVGVELQKDVYDLAVKNISYNNLSNQITVLNKDILDLTKMYESDSFDVVISNPPYFKLGEESNVNDDIHKVIARHEKCITLEDIIKTSKYLLKNNGYLAMVHRTSRLIDIIRIMSDNNIEVKKIRFIYPKVGTESNLVLIEGSKNGNPGLKILPPLYVHNDDGSYTDDVLMYFK